MKPRSAEGQAGCGSQAGGRLRRDGPEEGAAGPDEAAARLEFVKNLNKK